MSDELIDILDEQGNHTGKTCLKSEAHAKGLFHATVHVWLFTSDGNVLLQKRALTKKVFPGLWDISVAGHIGAGENTLDAAIREVNEEIGFRLAKEKLYRIGTRKHQVAHPNGIQDNEFHQVFMAELTVPIARLKIDLYEVAALKLFPLETLTATENLENVLLPQFHEYYCKVYDKINSFLSGNHSKNQ